MRAYVSAGTFARASMDGCSENVANPASDAIDTAYTSPSEALSIHAAFGASVAADADSDRGRVTPGRSMLSGLPKRDAMNSVGLLSSYHRTILRHYIDRTVSCPARGDSIGSLAPRPPLQSRSQFAPEPQ